MAEIMLEIFFIVYLRLCLISVLHQLSDITVNSEFIDLFIVTINSSGVALTLLF